MWIEWLPTDMPSIASRNGTMPPSGYFELLPLRLPFCQAMSLLAHWSRLTPVDAARTPGTPHEQDDGDGDGEDPDADGDPLAAYAASAVSVQIPERIACASERHSHRSSHPGDLKRVVSGQCRARPGHVVD
jgi:hypothetical protein